MAMQPVRMALSGAAGKICSSLLFRVAHGDPFARSMLDRTVAELVEERDDAFALLA